MQGYPSLWRSRVASSICISRHLLLMWNWIALKAYACFCSINPNDNDTRNDNLPEEKQVIIELINEYDD